MQINFASVFVLHRGGMVPSLLEITSMKRDSFQSVFRNGTTQLAEMVGYVSEKISPQTIKGSGVLIGFAVVLLALIVATSVQALTVTNRGTEPEEIIVIEGNLKESIVVQPQETIRDLCEAGCIIRLHNGDETAFDGSEFVVVTDEGLTVQEQD